MDPLGNRQRLGIRHQKTKVADQAAIDRAVTADLQHREVDIREDRRPPATAQPAEADVTRAACQIEQPPARPGIEQACEDLLPGPVDAERHQVVHEVVARRHALEHGPHHGFLLRARHSAESEVRLVWGDIAGGFAHEAQDIACAANAGTP